jgi:hypothetical protein
MVGFNLFHIVLLGCSLPCIRFALDEARCWPLSRSRLALPVVLTLVCAIIFLLFHLYASQPRWSFLAAFGAGLIVGAARGITIRMQVDHLFEKLRLFGAQVALMVAVLLVGAVLFEILGALLGEQAEFLRDMAPEIAAWCAGFFAGRAGVIILRSRNTPHSDFFRA